MHRILAEFPFHRIVQCYRSQIYKINKMHIPSLPSFEPWHEKSQRNEMSVQWRLKPDKVSVKSIQRSMSTVHTLVCSSIHRYMCTYIQTHIQTDGISDKWTDGRSNDEHLAVQTDEQKQRIYEQKDEQNTLTCPHVSTVPMRTLVCTHIIRHICIEVGSQTYLKY